MRYIISMSLDLFTEQQIPGALGSIKIWSKKGSDTTKTALILHHGAFEKGSGDNNRYHRLLSHLQTLLKEKPHIISYQTSRLDIPEPKWAEFGTSQYWQQKESYWEKAFAGKTFDDELKDIQSVYHYLLNNDHNQFSIDTIWSIGFSLGGTLALLLAGQTPQVQKICIFGSALSTKRATLPVLQAYWPKEKIIASIKSFNGSLKIFQGMEDTIVPQTDILALFEQMAEVEEISLTRLAGVNHMFSANNDFDLAKADLIIPELKEFFER